MCIRDSFSRASQAHETAVAHASDPVAADEIAPPLQDADDVRRPFQHLQRLQRDLDAAAIRVVVEDDLEACRLRRRQGMGGEAGLRRTIVIGMSLIHI